MNKMIYSLCKKIVLVFSFFTILSMFTLSFVRAKEEFKTSKDLTIEGAQIKVENVNEKETYHIRFVANVGNYDDIENVQSFGILFAFGRVKEDDLKNFVKDGTINNEKVFHAEVDGVTETGKLDDNKYYITIKNIPENATLQNITARAYVVSNGNTVYGEKIVIRNLNQVAQNAKENAELGFENVASKRIYVAYKNINNEIISCYFNDVQGENGLNQYLQKINDRKDNTAILVHFGQGKFGTSDEGLEITTNNIKITGNYQDYGLRKKEDLEDATIFLKQILIGNDLTQTNKKALDKIEINGVNISGKESLNLYYATTNLTVTNSVLNSDGDTDVSYTVKEIDDSSIFSKLYHENWKFENNYFNGISTKAQRIFNINGNISNVEMTGNYISDNSELSDTPISFKSDSYGIKLNRIKANDDKKEVKIIIKDNVFKYRFANYLIDLGYTNLSKNANIIIENNQICSTSANGATYFALGGNGIRVCNLKTGASVKIIHNYNFKTSTYFNAILLSTGNSAKEETNLEYPNILIKYNLFNVDVLTEKAQVIKPEARNTINTSRYTRIGLGIPSEYDGKAILDVTDNYYGNYTSPSRTAYGLVTSQKATTATNQSELLKVDTKDVANNLYKEYLTKNTVK